MTTVSVFVCCQAQAQPTHAVRPYASYSVAYDDNVLGLPDSTRGQPVAGSTDRSDMSRAVAGGVAFEKKVGQQLLSADLGLSDTKYDRLRQLDHQGRNLAANWNWHVGRHIEGNLRSSYVRSLAPFEDFHEPVENLRIQRRADVDIKWRFHPTWQVRSGVGRSEVAYSLPSQRTNDRELDYGEAAIDYVTASRNTVGLLLRRGRGTYPNPVTIGALIVSNDYEQDELRATVDWSGSGKTRLTFSGGAVSRKHETFPIRDFRGTNARLGFDWQVSGKLALFASVWRELAAVDNIVTAYSVNRGISLSPQWKISQKLQTDLQFRHESRDFKQSRAFINTSDFQDTLEGITWSLRYRPNPRWLLQTSLFRSEKDTDIEISSFVRKGASISVQYQF